jgi:hypothetical protein
MGICFMDFIQSPFSTKIGVQNLGFKPLEPDIRQGAAQTEEVSAQKRGKRVL